MSALIDNSRNRAQVTEHHIENTAHTKYPGNYHGHDDEWGAEKFKDEFEVVIVEYYKGRDLEIDMIGLAPAIANAYRRIMMAEVPTIAIEHCFIENNTSVIQDEMLAHRLGMIPIKADPTFFTWKPKNLGPENKSGEHTIVFYLRAKCEKIQGAEPDKTGRREDLYKDYKVYSGHLTYGFQRGQEEKVFEPVHKKILVAKLSGNQEIDIRLHAVKGIGRDHAKFSPVATVSYRLMPDIKLNSRIAGEAALRLKESFSKGVIELVGTDQEAKVVNSRIDSGSRNVFRYQDLKEKVHYDLIKDHFIFKVESTGCMPAMDILLQSCDILELKCEYFLRQVQSTRNRCSSWVDESAAMVEDI